MVPDGKLSSSTVSVTGGLIVVAGKMASCKVLECPGPTESVMFATAATFSLVRQHHDLGPDQIRCLLGERPG